MLYQPAHFRVAEHAHLLALMRAHPLGTVIGVIDGVPMVSIVPLEPVERTDGLVLLGHLAAANPQARALADGTRLVALFHGPQGFVSPASYPTTRQAVPTWNYVLVHAEGRVRRIDQGDDKEPMLKTMIDRHDPPYREQWDRELPASYRDGMKGAIVGFAIEVDVLDGKFKLSQNRPAPDRAGVLAALERGDAAARAAGQWMRRLGIAGATGAAADATAATTAGAAGAIRPVAQADEDAVVGLWAVVFPEYADPARPQREPRASVRRKLAHGDGLFWLAEQAGECVGTAMAGWDGHRGWLYSVAVHPQARRAGLGRALVAHAERELRARGCPKVNLQVLEQRTEARAFWTALGYAPDGVASVGKRLDPA